MTPNRLTRLEVADALLVEALRKLDALQREPEWIQQLPLRCPPVLWFGNSRASKPLVLTVGANPSRREFLTKRGEANGDQSQLQYLEPPRNRFRLLSTSETLDDFLARREFRQEVLESYDCYFSVQPYTGWFGRDGEGSYRVEGFLQGFGASYYDTDISPRQAVHVDLFPFATLADFQAIRAMVDSALFANGWAPSLLQRLVKYLLPAAIVVFGRTNCGWFKALVDPSVSRLPWRSSKEGPAQYFVGLSEVFDIPVVGLSTNLGNPKGFKALTLRAFGEEVRRSSEQIGAACATGDASS